MDQVRITRTLPVLLEACGVVPADVLRQARLPQTLFNQERIIVSTAQWFAFWNALDQISDDPALGLKLASEVRIEQYDPVSLGALSARSFHEALTKFARYKRLFCSEDMRVVEQNGAWHIEAVWTATQEPAPRLLIDSMFASFMELGQRGTGQTLYPERIMFQREPIHHAMYEAFFHCPVDFGANRNVAIYSHYAIEQPFRSHNPDLFAMLVPQLEAALLDTLRQQTVLDQVKALLRSRLAGQQPTIQDVASEFHISARTLQRRLAEEGAHFQQVLDAVRREMAEHYLTASSLDLNEIAYLLGYEEPSSFHRAFQHWEGTSPGQWRTSQRFLTS